MFVLNSHKPGEMVPAVVMRDGKEVKLEVTFQESQGRKEPFAHGSGSPDGCCVTRG